MPTRRPADDLYGGAELVRSGNVRFMFDYLHGTIAKQISPITSGNAGANFNALAMRTQVAF